MPLVIEAPAFKVLDSVKEYVSWVVKMLQVQPSPVVLCCPTGQQPQQPGAPPQQDYTKAWEEYYKKQGELKCHRLSKANWIGFGMPKVFLLLCAFL